MSSLVDAIVSQDLPSQPFSDDQPTPRPRQRRRGGATSSARGSSRPGNPTSEADQMEMDPDDEVVGPGGAPGGRAGRPRTDLSQVPKVTDEAGDQIMHAFTDFLERLVS
jgi:DNA replication licensing factor MCM6